ncbi:MAG: hypothetical protein OXQ93_07925 [Gemmatimonadota bacterium]|nr:hypothetical protein [bacterium]MDE2875351.1 hypothetical protein [Gemmatimonadota bacterium]
MTPIRAIVLFKLTLLASCQGSAPPPAESETEPSSRHTWETRFAERAEDDSHGTTAFAGGPRKAGLAGAVFVSIPIQRNNTKSERREAP